MPKRIALFGGKHGVCDRARRMGIDVFLIQKPTLFDLPTLRLCCGAVYIEYETDSAVIPMLRALHEDRAFDAVISITESGLLPAARAAEALGLPGMPSSEVVRRSLDKYAMRKHMESAKFTPVRAELGRNTADVRRFAAERSFPVIVKPRDSSGSKGVLKINSAAEVSAVDGLDEFLIEEFLAGPEISVETFSFNGRHKVFAITEKTLNDATSPNPYVEVGHRMPAAISAELRHVVVKYVADFLDLMEMSNGPAHTEVKLTDRGPRIVETHTRVGGDYITGLVRLVTGFDLFSLTLGWPLGLVSEPDGEIQARGGAAVQFFTPPCGVVSSLSGVEYWRQEPGVHLIELPLKAGDRIKPITTSADRVGFVVANGRDALEAASLCTAVRKGVEIIVETAPGNI
jgi:biotin carboxylase